MPSSAGQPGAQDHLRQAARVLVVQGRPDSAGGAAPRGQGRLQYKREAEEALAELISRAARGQSAVASRVPLGEYLDEWLATVRPSLAAAAWTVYCDDVATERQCVHRLGKANLPCTLWNDFDLGPTRTHERACSAPSR